MTAPPKTPLANRLSRGLGSDAATASTLPAHNPATRAHKAPQSAYNGGDVSSLAVRSKSGARTANDTQVNIDERSIRFGDGCCARLCLDLGKLYRGCPA
jgi:hypothetical protein